MDARDTRQNVRPSLSAHENRLGTPEEALCRAEAMRKIRAALDEYIFLNILSFMVFIEPEHTDTVGIITTSFRVFLYII
jgi:hypothetical protein